MSRATTSRVGASTPTCWNVGSTAMSSDPAPIRRMVAVRAVLRLSRSATAPISRPPMGRMEKPMAKIAKVLSRAVSPAWSFVNIWVEKYTARNE